MSDLPPKTLLALPSSLGVTLPAPFKPQATPAELPQAVRDQLLAAQGDAKAPNTRRSYDSAWKSFVAWCFQRRGTSLPAAPATVAGHMVELANAGRCAGTLDVRLAAISERHVSAGLEDPTKHHGVREVVAGLRRKLGTKPKTKKAAATLDVIRKLVGGLDRTTLEGKRDAAVLLVGFAGAFRRSTLVARTLADLSWLDKGVVLFIGKEKQDQEGVGREVGISRVGGELCPVTALEDWLRSAKIATVFSTTRPFEEKGFLFRGLTSTGKGIREAALSADYVADIVKGACVGAGIDPKTFSGHSLRAGHVTEALLRGVPFDAIMSQTGHSNPSTMLGYRRAVDAIKGGDSGLLGLGERKGSHDPQI